MRQTSLALLQVLMCACFVGVAHAQELEMVNRPVNTSGLTGLAVTTSPFALPKGALEIGVSALSERSARPEFTLTEYPLTITIGVAGNTEICLKGSYLWYEETNGARKRGTGDSELLAKWNFIGQEEPNQFPAMSFFASVRGLTGDSEMGFNRVHNWGASFGLAVGGDVAWEDHILGLYADASVVVQDLNENVYRDRYGIYNVGIILPISKQRNLQLLVEHGGVGGKRSVNIDGGNLSVTTYGLRLVSESFNLTVGSQFIHKQLESYDNSGRVIGTFSVKF